MLQQLQSKLGLSFKSEALLHEALVHPSYLNENPGFPLGSYDRLEFLGDAILNTVVAQELFLRGPQLTEGDLTKGRAFLVRGEYLAGLAESIGLGGYLFTGRGEEATGGRSKESSLEAVMEALVGAVFLDRGYQAARDFVLKYMLKDIQHIVAHGIASDPKAELLELVQKTDGEKPEYRLVESSGPVHAPSFVVEVLVNSQVMGRGRGKRKLDAERLAAKQALEQLAYADPTRE